MRAAALFMLRCRFAMRHTPFRPQPCAFLKMCVCRCGWFREEGEVASYHKPPSPRNTGMPATPDTYHARDVRKPRYVDAAKWLSPKNIHEIRMICR